MSKKKRENAGRLAGTATGAQVGASLTGAIGVLPTSGPGAISGEFVVRDPQAIAAAMEDTVDEVISETVPDPVPDVTETVPEPDPVEPGRDVAGQPSTVHLEDALVHWGLTPDDVLGWAGGPEEGLRIVTKGGTKVRWPDDMERHLTENEKGRVLPSTTGTPGGVGRFARETQEA